MLPGWGRGSVHGLSCEVIFGPLYAWAADKSVLDTRGELERTCIFSGLFATFSVAIPVRGGVMGTVGCGGVAATVGCGGVAATVGCGVEKTLHGGVAQKLGVPNAF